MLHERTASSARRRIDLAIRVRTLVPRLARSRMHMMATLSPSSEVAGTATDRVERRRLAEAIARKHQVDAGDVEHVLLNLTLPPLERLRRSRMRARLGRPAR